MLVAQNSAGTLDTLATSRGIRALEDSSRGPVFDALNMPQALQDMIPPGQTAAIPAYGFRQPSMERGALQPSPIAPGSPVSSRGLYAFRQLSPSAQIRNHTPGLSNTLPSNMQTPQSSRQRALSPGAQRGSMNAPPGHPGAQSPRRQPTPGRALLSEHRIQRITSAPPNQPQMGPAGILPSPMPMDRIPGGPGSMPGVPPPPGGGGPIIGPRRGTLPSTPGSLSLTGSAVVPQGPPGSARLPDRLPMER